MRLRFPRIIWLVGFMACCAMACNIANEFEGPGEDQIEQEKQQEDYEKGWRITQTFLHTTPEFIWSDKPKKTIDFEYTLTQQALLKTCYWEWNEASFAEGEISGLDKPKGATASRTGNSIVLTYPHSGAFGCPEQVLQTTHRWETFPIKFKAGEAYAFTVSAEWSLKGTRECSPLMAGVSSEVIAGKTRITASRSGIVISKEPGGSVKNTVTWTAPGHSFSGDEFEIIIRGVTGNVGYSLSYEYIYRCYNRE